VSVYSKLNEARAKFHALELKKTGHNKFAGYNYFELGDFLIPALKVFNEVGLCAIVSFDKELATMRIIDTDPNGGNITITSPLSEANLKGCHPVQNVGACETYARRYLWVAALEIVEHDALDATTGKTEKKDGVSTDVSVSPTSEAFKALQPEVQDRMRKLAVKVSAAESASAMLDIIDFEDLDNDQKAGLWSLLDSKVRASIKKAQQEIAK
jgi:hypothetical protein